MLSPLFVLFGKYINLIISINYLEFYCFALLCSSNSSGRRCRKTITSFRRRRIRKCANKNFTRVRGSHNLKPLICLQGSKTNEPNDTFTHFADSRVEGGDEGPRCAALEQPNCNIGNFQSMFSSSKQGLAVSSPETGVRRSRGRRRNGFWCA